MSHPMITVCVPVYDVSKYLPECIASIRAQTLQAIEIILVNDASPDPLDRTLCLEAAEADARIRYFEHEINRGLGGARNTAIAAARADYLVFIDSDDYVSHDLCQRVYGAFRKDSCDLVGYGAWTVKTAPIEQRIWFSYEDKLLHNDKILEEYLVHGALKHSSWSYAVRKRVFTDNNISFPENIVHQDLPTSLQVFFFASKMRLLSKHLYYYRSRAQSIVQTVSEQHVSDVAAAVSQTKAFLEAQDVFTRYEAQWWRLFFLHRVFFHINTRVLKKSRNEQHARVLLESTLADLTRNLDLASLCRVVNLDALSSNLTALRRQIDVIPAAGSAKPTSHIIANWLQDIEFTKICSARADPPYPEEPVTVAFAFDENYSLPALVAAFSLALHANETTVYSIYLLVDDDVTDGSLGLFRDFFCAESRHSVTCVRMRSAFSDAHETRGITRPTYFRLLLHRILPDVTTAIYVDVDTVILDDLSDLKIPESAAVGAVRTPHLSDPGVRQHFLGMEGDYFNAGVAVLNLARLRSLNIDEALLEHALRKYVCQDQDALNIVCKGHVAYLHPRYNCHGYIQSGKMDGLYSAEEIESALMTPAIFHWTGKKPWSTPLVPYSQLWWQHLEKLSEAVNLAQRRPARTHLPAAYGQLTSVTRLTPRNRHFFLGTTGSEVYRNGVHLAVEATFVHRRPRPSDYVDVSLVQSDGTAEVIARTNAWCFQQSNMLQFRPSHNEIVYNVFDECESCFRGVIFDADTRETRFLDRAVSAVSPQGDFALGLDFSRLYSYSNGDGYCNVTDYRVDSMAPDEDGLFKIDLETGRASLLIAYRALWEDFARGTPAELLPMLIDRVSINDDGGGILLRIRWFSDAKPWPTLTLVARSDGTDVRRVFGFSMDCDWRGTDRLAIVGVDSVDKRSVSAFTLWELDVRSGMSRIVDDVFFAGEGYFSYSPDYRFIVFGATATKEAPYQRLLIYDREARAGACLGYFYAPPDLVGNCFDCRCNLRPRWSHDGRFISFDSTHEGYRAIYSIAVSDALTCLQRGLSELSPEDVAMLHAARVRARAATDRIGKPRPADSSKDGPDGPKSARGIVLPKVSGAPLNWKGRLWVRGRRSAEALGIRELTAKPAHILLRLLRKMHGRR